MPTDKPRPAKKATKKKTAAKPAPAPAAEPVPAGKPTGIRIRALLRIHQGGRWIEKGETADLEARHVAKGRAEYVTTNPTGEKTDG